MWVLIFLITYSKSSNFLGSDTHTSTRKGHKTDSFQDESELIKLGFDSEINEENAEMINLHKISSPSRMLPTGSEHVSILLNTNDIKCVNFQQTITVLLTDSNNANWNSLETITLTSSSDAVYDANPVASSTGVFIFKVTFKSPGTKTITATTGSAATATSSPISIASLMIKSTFSGNEIATNTDNLFIYASVFDSTGTYQETSNTYLITVTLYCNNVCSGTSLSKTTSGNTNFGQATFQYVNVLSSGNFSFLATSPGIISGLSSPIIVTNSIKSITISTDMSSQTEFFSLTAFVNIYGTDNNLFILPTTVYLNSTDQNNTLSGQIVTQTTTGTLNCSVFFVQSGLKKILVSTNSSSITAMSSMLSIFQGTLLVSNMINPLPVNTREPFQFTIGYYDHTGKILETDNGPLIVTFSLEPSGSITGQTSVKLVNGVGQITTLNIGTEGTFRIDIVCGDAFSQPLGPYYIQGVDCNIGSGPVACMSVLLFLVIMIPFIFYFSDKLTKEYPRVKHVVLLIYPFTSLFYKQPYYRRSFVIIQLCVSELVMLTLIGGIYAYYDKPTSHYNANFTDYYAREVYKGATGWALAQAVTLPLFFLTFFTIQNKKLNIYVLVISIILMILCFGSVIGMTIEYCIGFSYYWTANFLIFILGDQILLFPVYTLICFYMMDKNLREKLTIINKKGDQDTVLKNADGEKLKKKGTGNPEDNNDKEGSVYEIQHESEN